MQCLMMTSEKHKRNPKKTIFKNNKVLKKNLCKVIVKKKLEDGSAGFPIFTVSFLGKANFMVAWQFHAGHVSRATAHRGRAVLMNGIVYL